MTRKKIILVSFLLILGVIFLVSLASELFSDRVAILTTGILILCISLSVIFERISHFGISDPVSIFLSFFMLYNGSVLVSSSFFVDSGSFSIGLFPMTFRSETLAYSGVLSLLALCGLLLGSKIIRLSNHDSRSKCDEVKLHRLNPGLLMFVGLIFYVAGILMYLYCFRAVGGFFASLSMDRSLRLAILGESLSLPYPGFVLSGIGAVFFASIATKRKFYFSISLLCLALWSALILLQGDRRFFVYSLMIVLVIWAMLYADRVIKMLSFRKLISIFLVLLMLIAMLSVFSAVRFLIPVLFTGYWNLEESIAWIRSNFSIDWFVPARTEFGAPYFSLLYNVQNKGDLLLGSSYVFSIPNILPESLYPGTKPDFLANIFARRIHDEFYTEKDLVKGWGYSPVAEAFQNFGFYGVFFVFLLLGLLLEVLCTLRHRNVFLSLVFVASVPEMLNLNRMCFAPVVQEYIFLLVPFTMLYFFYRLLSVGKT